MAYNAYTLTEKEKSNQKYLLMSAMKILNLTQSELARELNCDPSLITRWMNGSNKISVPKALQLSKLIPEITVNQLCPWVFK